LKSANYDFELVDFPTSRLSEILTRQADYHPAVEDRVDAGRGWVDQANERHWQLPSLMVTYRDFPAPIIVLDNLDGHVTRDEEEARREGMPKGLLLIEGHNRLDVASYLLTIEQFKPVVKVWMMKRRPQRRS
jgi:hypothetical protein